MKVEEYIKRLSDHCVVDIVRGYAVLNEDKCGYHPAYINGGSWTVRGIREYEIFLNYTVVNDDVEAILWADELKVPQRRGLLVVDDEALERLFPNERMRNETIERITTKINERW